MNDQEIVALRALVEKLRERERELRAGFPGVPCQSETEWHADEIAGWADDLDAVLRPEGDPHGQ